MNRLQAEQNRLFLPTNTQSDLQNPEVGDISLIGADGRVRAMVVELAQPAGWDGVAGLWQGIQDDLDLPAPAIAVNGIDGYQVWLSLSESVPITQAQDFLESLRLRFLSDIASKHIGMYPQVRIAAPWHAQHGGLVPALREKSGRWSAFVAPGLAGMFADEPWLDMPPNPDAQANLLSGFKSIQPAELKLAQDRLSPVNASSAGTRKPESAETTRVDDPRQYAEQSATREVQDPKAFLLAVMNDPSVELRLRIEAAKALLPYQLGSGRRIRPV